MMCAGAGWHDERAITVPDNVTLAFWLPQVRVPRLNPVERVWLYLRDGASYRAASSPTPRPSSTRCCQAWIDLIRQNRMVLAITLCAYPWTIMKVIS